MRGYIRASCCPRVFKFNLVIINFYYKIIFFRPELAFVVYPEGISLMGEIAPLFSVFFFIMMLALGFGSEFSIMESVMSRFFLINIKKALN